MRVLVTGHRGYIGSVLTCVLRHARFEVVGLDTDLFDGCNFGRIDETIPSYDCDIREIEFADLLSFDAVVHLAGLCREASEVVDAPLVEDINAAGTVRLAECCRRAGVDRLILASSTSLYAGSSHEPLWEDAPLRAGHPYDRSKQLAERALANMSDGRFHGLSLRLGETFGMSPRLRIDSLVNRSMASAVARGRVVVDLPPHAWRPLVHVEDAARAITNLLLLPDDDFPSGAINLVNTGDPQRVIDIADEIVGLVPECTRWIRPPQGPCPSLQLSNDRLLAVLPEFAFRWNLSLGVRQLFNAMSRAGMTPGDVRSDRYCRGPRLSRLICHRWVDDELRPVPAELRR